MRMGTCVALTAVLALSVGCGDKSKHTRSDDDDDAKKDRKHHEKSDASSKASGSAAAAAIPQSKGTGSLPLKPVAVAPADPSFTLTSNTAKPGEDIEVTFGSALQPPEGQQYWLTIVKSGAADSDYGNWHYVKAGATSDTLKAPAAGDYEIRLHDLYPKFGYKVLKRDKITVACEGAGCGEAPSPPAPPAPPEPPKPVAGSDGYLADGWPAEIPARGSSAPSTDEWNAMTKEVTVWHSSTLHCETKMIREWLRVSCHKNDYGNPTGVEETASDGQQAFKFADGQSVASLVLEVIPGKSYSAVFGWENAAFEFDLSWPNGGRPEAHFFMPTD